MRNRFAETFYQLASQRRDLCAIVADISPAGSMTKFRDDFPDRFINTGVAEQVMIGIAAGMAQRGFRPFAYTIATFALFRPFEMVRVDLCYQDLPVTVVGIGGGLSYSTLGGTHHAHEDVPVACAIPGLQVIAPCDPEEVQAATEWCAAVSQHPTYLRLGKAGEPSFQAEEPWRFGRLRYLQRGEDICILSYGPIMGLARAVADKLTEFHWGVSLISVHTLKPLDTEGILDALHSHLRVVIIEEAPTAYSLGVRVRALAQLSGATCAIVTFGLDDAFTHAYGTHAELLALHGLTVEKIVHRIDGR